MLSLSVLIFSSLCMHIQNDVVFAKYRFLSNYPEALITLKSFYSHSEIHASLHRNPDPAKPVTKETTIAIKRHGDLLKGILTRWDINDMGRKEFVSENVFAFGEKARFQLAKDASGRGYGLSQLLPGRLPAVRNPTDAVYTQYNVAIGRYALVPYQVEFLFVENLLNESAFKITQCTTTRDREEEVFRIDFVSTGKGASSISGLVELLPEKKWAARRYSIKTVAPALGVKGAVKARQHDCEINYKLVDDFPVPIMAKFKDDLGLIVCDYQDVRSETGDASNEREFELSYFGIPDYLAQPGGKPDRTGFIILSASAIVSLVLAIAFWRRSRRHAKPA